LVTSLPIEQGDMDTFLPPCESTADPDGPPGISLQRRQDRDLADLWTATRGFFVLTLIIFAADLVILFSLRSPEKPKYLPNYLVSSAALVAACCIFLAEKSRRSDPDGAVPGKFPFTLSAEGWSTTAVFLAFLAFYAATGWLDPSPFNAHVLQAVQFLHGHIYLDAGDSIEQVTFEGHRYGIHPPLPAVLMMPFAAIWGTDVNQTIFSLIFGTINVALAWQLLGRLNISVNARIWFTIFYGVGTTLWFETINGGSWDVTETVAIGFTLAALSESFGQARPALVAFLAGLASLARYDMGPVFPVYVGLVYLRRRNWRELFWMIPGFAMAGIVFMGLNVVRYHYWFDIGEEMLAEGRPLFRLRYFFDDFYTLIFLPPGLDDKFPYIHPQGGGLALTLLSPAFVLALRPSFRNPTTALVGLGAIISMLTSLFFLWTGYLQVGTRHYIHAFPFLLILMAFGTGRQADQLTKIMISVSVVLVAFTVWHMRMWGFG